MQKGIHCMEIHVEDDFPLHCQNSYHEDHTALLSLVRSNIVPYPHFSGLSGHISWLKFEISIVVRVHVWHIRKWDQPGWRGLLNKNSCFLQVCLCQWVGCVQSAPLSKENKSFAVCLSTVCLRCFLQTGFELAELTAHRFFCDLISYRLDRRPP